MIQRINRIVYVSFRCSHIYYICIRFVLLLIQYQYLSCCWCWRCHCCYLFHHIVVFVPLSLLTFSLSLSNFLSSARLVLVGFLFFSVSLSLSLILIFWNREPKKIAVPQNPYNTKLKQMKIVCRKKMCLWKNFPSTTFVWDVFASSSSAYTVQQKKEKTRKIKKDR